MEKIKISFNEDELETSETIKIGNKAVEVKTYISLPIQGVLIQQYCEELTDITSPIEMRILRAKIKLCLAIVSFMTNLEIEDIDEYSFPLDEFIASGAYAKILEKITNYNDFENILNLSVDLLFKDKYNKPEMLFKLENIIGEVESLLGKITNMDLDKDGIAELLEAVLKTQKEFNDKYQIIEPSEDIAPVIDSLAENTNKPIKGMSSNKKKSN